MDWLKEIKAVIDRMQGTLDKYSEALRLAPSDVHRERVTAAANDASWWLDILLQIYGRGLEQATGYDVYCSQDAPTFAHWERVAWFVDEKEAQRYCDGRSERTNFWNRSRMRFDLVEQYRILPAGSPAPEDGAL